MPARFACYLVAMAAVTAVFDAEAEAEPPLLVKGQVALRYRRAPNAAAECLDEGTFRERSGENFGYQDPFTPPGADAPAHLHVEVTRAADDFLATVFSADAGGYAVFTERATSCDELGWRLALRMGGTVHRAPGEPLLRRAPRLRYTQGPPECDSEVDFRSEVAILGDGVDRFDAGGAETVGVTFELLPSGRFRATIEHPGAKDGHEVQTHAHCETLARHVAMAVYRFVPAPDLPATPPPASPMPATPELPRPLAQLRVRPLLCRILSDDNCMDLTIRALAMGIMTAGYTPDVGGGFAVGVGVGGEVFSVDFAFRGVFPSPVVASTPIYPSKPYYAVPFDLSQWSGQIVPCARWKFVMGCAFVEVGGLVTATSAGLGGALLFAAGPRLGVDVPLNDRLSVFGFGEARFSVVRAHLDWDSPPVNHPDLPIPNTTWVTPIVSAGFGVGLTAHFK